MSVSWQIRRRGHSLVAHVMSYERVRISYELVPVRWHFFATTVWTYYNELNKKHYVCPTTTTTTSGNHTLRWVGPFRVILFSTRWARCTLVSTNISQVGSTWFYPPGDVRSGMDSFCLYMSWIVIYCLSGSFSHSYWCRQKSRTRSCRKVAYSYNNVDLISETYEDNYNDIASGKLQIRRFQPPHFGLTTVLREKPSTIYKKIYIARNY